MTESSPYLNEDSPQNNPPIIGVVGLGYVGLPVAIGFSERYSVIGFDVDEDRVSELKQAKDRTGEISVEMLKNAGITFTNDAKQLSRCNFIIVAVPTPVTADKEPDLSYIKEASKLIGENLSKGSTVVFESTVYPGTTEEVCIPVLEDYSGMKSGMDFYVGYSPERINPGDKEHTFKNNAKVVSGQNEETLDKIYHLYQSVIESEVYKAPSIKVAEACKIVENAQRDVNIAFMNELSLIFDALNIDTYEVINAAKTKWNFAPYSPGLVGGHCIGVDPYYLIYKSKMEGYQPKLLSMAREINDFMPSHVVQSLLEMVVANKLDLSRTVITVLGITFKENVPDLRNSKALEIVNALVNLGLRVQVVDPYVEKNPFVEGTVDFTSIDEMNPSEIIILAVSHKEFKDPELIKRILPLEKGMIMDLKGIIPAEAFDEKVTIWRL